MTPDEQRLADLLRAPALVESPESIHRHDPQTTRAFEAIFSHPDNADVERAFTMSLAVNDPERPADPEPLAPSSGGTAVLDDGCEPCTCPDPVGDLAEAILKGRVSLRSENGGIRIVVADEEKGDDA